MEDIELNLEGPSKDGRVDFAAALLRGFEAVRDGKTAWLCLNTCELVVKRKRGRPVTVRELPEGWLKPANKVALRVRESKRIENKALFLRDVLSKGPVLSNVIMHGANWTERKDIYHAAKVLGVLKYPIGRGTDQKWMWELSDE